MLLQKSALTTFIIFLSLLIFKQLETKQQIQAEKQEHMISGHVGFSFKPNSEPIKKANIAPPVVVSKPTHEPKIPSQASLPSQVIKLEGIFLDSFFEPVDNLTQLSDLQKQISDGYRTAKHNVPNIYQWDIMFVYYLAIEEGLSLEQINEFRSIRDAGHDDSLIDILHSLDFYRRVSFFKGIDANNTQYNVTLHRAIARMGNEKSPMRKIASEEEFQKSLKEMNYSESQKQEMLTGFYNNQQEEF